MSFFSTLLRLCFVILPPSEFRHSPLWLQHERCNLLETKTKLSENPMTDLGSAKSGTPLHEACRRSYSLSVCGLWHAHMFVLFEYYVAEEIGTMKIGLRQVYREERKEVRSR